MNGKHRRLLRWLPGYLSGGLSERRRRWVEREVARSAELRAESDALRRLAELLQTNDPASPVDPAELDRLRPLLHAALDEALARRPAVWLYQPVLAGALAVLLFVGGLATGSGLFPREVQVPVERRVEVPVEHRVEVPVPVEKRVEVPVEKVVTRWRTRTVERTVTRVVYRDRPAATRPTTHVERPASRPVELVQVDRPAAREAALPPTVRPSSVEF